jgi:hypothetical protein
MPEQCPTGDTPYGKALHTSSSTHSTLATLQREYAHTLSTTYAAALERILLDFKEFDRLVAKLESRRLDFDAKLSRVHKAKKERPELEEGTRTAQAKYEETLSTMTSKMIELNCNEEDQLDKLLLFTEGTLRYHQQAAREVESLMQRLRAIPRDQPSPTSTSLPKTLSHMSLDHASGSVRSSLAMPVVLSTPGRGGPTTSSYSVPGKVNPFGSSGVARQPPMPGKTASAPNGHHQGPTPPAFSNTSPRAVPAPTVPAPIATSTARALYDFAAEEEGELSLAQGDLVSVVGAVDDNWLEGQHLATGRTGIFPANVCLCAFACAFACASY